MRIGATVPRDLLPDGRGALLLDIAGSAERAGLASIWMSDHLLMVAGAHGYPYTSDNSFARHGDTPWYEAVSVLSWIASASTTLQVGTSVLIAPQRNPLELAKATATIDHLSGGRVLLGVGAGWLREEFETLGYDYDSRGSRLDGSIDVLRAAWTGHIPAGDYGPVHVAHDAFCHPRPHREQGIPVLIGGMTARAERRAIARGDGWLARAWIDTLSNEKEELTARLRRIRAGIAERNPGSAQYHVLRIVTRNGTPSMSGSGVPSRALRDALQTARDIGFDEAAFDVDWSGAQMEDELRQLARAVG